jgi:multiple sugar transport system ATP-binding protein
VLPHIHHPEVPGIPDGTGKCVNEVAPADRGISMVFQNYALYPHMTVEKNISYGLKNMKVPADEIKKKVDWAIDILGLEEYRYRKPKNLSGGQRQRVALGRAIVKDQKVFLMDEPLSNLDAKLRVSMRNEISKLHRNLGSTTIYVTHDQVEAMTMADRIVIMKDGVIQQVGKPMDLYEHPVNKFVAGFIGSPQMNFYDVKVDGKKSVKLKINVRIIGRNKNIVSNTSAGPKNAIPIMDSVLFFIISSHNALILR